MELYVTLLNEVMQIVGRERWGPEGRPSETCEAFVENTHRNSYKHTTVCIILGTAFRGEGFGQAKPLAKKHAHKQVAHQIFPDHDLEHCNDTEAAKSMRRIFSTAKGGDTLRDFLQASVSRLHANPPPLPMSNPAVTRAPMPLRRPAYSGASKYGPGPSQPLGIRRPGPTVAAPPAMHSAYLPPAAATAPSRPPVAQDLKPVANPSASMARPVALKPETPAPERKAFRYRPKGRNAFPREATPYQAPKVDLLATPMNELQRNRAPAGLFQREHAHVALCAVLRSLGSQWRPDLPVVVNHRGGTDAGPRALNFGVPALATVTFSSGMIRAMGRQSASGPEARPRDPPPLPLSVRLFDDLLKNSWRLRMPDGTSRMQTCSFRAGGATPTVDLGPRHREDDRLIFELILELQGHQDPGRAERFWQRFVAAAETLPGYTPAEQGEAVGPPAGDLRIPRALDLGDGSGERPRSEDAEMSVEDQRLAALRRSHMHLLPQSTQALYRSCLVPLRRGEDPRGARTLHPQAVQRAFEAVPRLRQGDGKLHYRGVALEGGIDALRAVGLDSHRLDFKTGNCEPTECMVEWTSIVAEVGKVLDYLLAVGSARDMGAFRDFLTAFLTTSPAGAVDSSSFEAQLSAATLPHLRVHARFGDLWAVPAILRRARDLLYLHAAGCRRLAGLTPDFNFFIPATSSADADWSDTIEAVPLGIHEILSMPGGVGDAVNGGFAATARGCLERRICDSAVLTHFHDIVDPEVRATFESCAAKAHRIVSALVQVHVLPPGQRVLHHCSMSPLAHVYHRGTHHINLQDNWYHSFLVTLPPRLTPAARLMCVAAVTIEPSREGAASARGPHMLGQQSATTSPPAAASKPATSFASPLEATLRCLFVGLLQGGQGDVIVDKLNEHGSAYALTCADTAQRLAMLEIDVGFRAVSFSLAENPWNASQSGDFFSLAMTTLLRKRTLVEACWYQTEGVGELESASKQRLRLQADGSLAWEGQPSVPLRAPSAPTDVESDAGDANGDMALNVDLGADDDSRTDGDTDAAEEKERPELAAERLRKETKAAEAETLAGCFFGNVLPCRHVVRLVVREFPLLLQAMRHILEADGPHRSFLGSRAVMLSSLSSITLGTTRFLLDPGLRGRMYFRGFLVGVGQFPYAGVTFSDPRPRPSSRIDTAEAPSCVIDGGCLEKLWEGILTHHRGEMRRFFKGLNAEVREAGGSPGMALAIKAGGDLSAPCADLGPVFGRWDYQAKLLQTAENSVPVGTVPLRHTRERDYLWHQYQPPRPTSISALHPLVHEAMAYEGRSLYAFLCQNLVEKTPVIRPTEVLCKEDLSLFSASLEAFGLYDYKHDELVFHDSPDRPLLYARVGRFHHFNAWFLGRELLAQLLLSVPEGQQLRVLGMVQEGLLKSPTNGIRYAGFLVVDALQFILGLNTLRVVGHKRAREHA